MNEPEGRLYSRKALLNSKNPIGKKDFSVKNGGNYFKLICTEFYGKL